MATTSPPTIQQRVERLSAAAARRVVEPDEAVPGGVGGGPVLPPSLLSVAGLDLDLTPDQQRVLAAEEVASIAQAGIRFEAVLCAGFGAQIATTRDLTDPRLTFILHELGEETRHQRLFQRLIAELDPQARSPLPFRLVQLGYRFVIHATVRLRSLFYVLVLAGEEIPDLLQKMAAEHPDTDPFVREVNRYHRMEEARHLSFARAVLPEIWADAGPVDRAAVRRVAPRLVRVMFDMLVHPGVYWQVGLPGFATWRRANRTRERVQIRREATRPVLEALLESGALRRGRISRPWRRLCGVDRHGRPAEPLADLAALTTAQSGPTEPAAPAAAD